MECQAQGALVSDHQSPTSLSLLGFTPSDRSKLGLAEVKAKSKLEELMERRANRDLDAAE